LRITLQAPSHVEGDIFHQSLAIEQGAYFEGKSRRSDDPLAETKALSTNGSASFESRSAESSPSVSSASLPPVAAE
jgi:cytoskeletal protein CcmA (bactofilin family)